MMRVRLRRLALAMLVVPLVLSAFGCNGDLSNVTFLDLLNTVLLGITAAGGIVLIRNI